MPVLDGFGATQKIREAEEQKLRRAEVEKNKGAEEQKAASSIQHPVPIIAVSASVFETTRKRALAIGFNDFLFKPFQLENLLELLHTHLQVEWRYEKVEEQPEIAFPIPPEPQPIVPLPSEEVNILLKLAERGNVKRILEQLNHIEGLGKQFLPLVNELRTLARSFQIDKIVENLEKMEKKT
jgi:CheY-like chemotaxis protein